MSLKEQINNDLKAAMRAKDSARVDTLRLLNAAIQRREVDERIQLDDAQVLTVAEKLIKQSREAIEQYEKGNRADLVEKEKRDIATWQQYLPTQLSDAELDTLIAAAITATGAASIKDMGKLMGELKPKLAGRADMGKVSAKVKARLGS